MHSHALHHQINAAEVGCCRSGSIRIRDWRREAVYACCAGLSVAKVDNVSGDTVIFRGADVVDGTPVLDIKPYIPYVDGGVDAHAPAWVSIQDPRRTMQSAC